MPSNSHTMLFKFIPNSRRKYHEQIEITSRDAEGQCSSTVLNIRGEGLEPVCEIEGIPDSEIDLGTCLLQSKMSSGFILRNKSEFEIAYRFVVSVPLNVSNHCLELYLIRLLVTVFD